MNRLCYTKNNQVYVFDGANSYPLTGFTGKYVDAGPDGIPLCARERGDWRSDDPITHGVLSKNLLGTNSESGWRRKMGSRGRSMVRTFLI